MVLNRAERVRRTKRCIAPVQVPSQVFYQCSFHAISGPEARLKRIKTISVITELLEL